MCQGCNTSIRDGFLVQLHTILFAKIYIQQKVTEISLRMVAMKIGHISIYDQIINNKN